ncbi:hypothetical protein NEUTE2DRAFT_169271 [Neurospora tetrasperma FGSC 2509]|nr:hypothetical protein NEUTE2DRAFT_169271 [Neurospora tetrasperma FGSC 2509]
MTSLAAWGYYIQTLAALQVSNHRHIQAFRLIHNKPAGASDVLNYQTNVKAAISKGFLPGQGPEPIFPSPEPMKGAWDNLEYFEMDGTIGPMDGERHEGEVYRRGAWRYAFIHGGPWVGFKKCFGIFGHVDTW